MARVMCCLLPVALAELCWRDSVPRSRRAWSDGRCMLARSSEVPHCGWRVANRGPTRWEVSATLDHQDGICALTWSPSGRISAASADGTVSLWEGPEPNYTSWTLKALLGATHQAPVRDITWSPEGQLLAASVDGSSRVWRLAGNATRIHVEPGEPSNESEDELQSNSSNDTMPRRKLEPPAVQGLLLEPWDVQSMLQQPDSALAVEWSNRSALGRVFVSMRERTACSASSQLEPCAVDGQERRLGAMYLGLEHSAAIWHSSKEMPKRWALEATFEGTRNLLVSVRWSPDGDRILIGGSDGVVRIWELEDTDFHGSGRQRWKILTQQQVHSQAVRAVAWSPDGQRVLTSSAEGARIWRPFNGSEWDLEGSLTAANGRKVRTNLTNTAARPPEDYPRLDSLDPDANMDWMSRWSPILVAAWSPDGRRILTGSKDGSARIWLQDWSVGESWTLEATLHGHNHEIWALAWSGDSMEVVTGDQVGKVRLWREGA